MRINNGCLQRRKELESSRKIDEYSKRAKEQRGQTSEFKEFEEKTKNWTKDDEATAANEFMQLFVEFGQMKEMNPADEQVQLQVKKLQDYITNHFYTCSDKILCGLGRMYAGGGELTENIDNVGGTGTAEFASKAIDIFYITGEYATPAGYLVDEKEAEAFDRAFPYMEKEKLPGQIS